jgi:hypothetical protein
MSEIIEFPPNIPVSVALKYTNGKSIVPKQPKDRFRGCFRAKRYPGCFAAFRERLGRQAYPSVIALGSSVACPTAYNFFRTPLQDGITSYIQRAKLAGAA